MEKKIVYIGQKHIASKKKGDFYVIYYIADHEPVTAFVDIEVYNKIGTKKLKELAECTGIFEIVNTQRGMQVVLADIK